MASRAQDDGFHEIQLSGKQLVFLFMAATVVSVVIFLCGVLVGRGVRAERSSAAAEAAAIPSEPPLPAAQPAPAPPPAGSDPTAAAPPPTATDGLTYPETLEHPNANRSKPDLKAKPAPAKESTPAAPVAKAEPKPEPAKPEPPKASPPKPVPAAQTAAAPAAASGGEFTVQVAAINALSEADSIAKRLNSKGYQAYVVPPGNGAAMYRVRVGKFKTRRDAEPTAARLQREEKYKPWITR